MKFALVLGAAGLFFIGLQLRGIVVGLDRMNKTLRRLDTSVTTQTCQHSYIAKTYMKPVLPQCWDYLSRSCVTCGSERENWNLPWGNYERDNEDEAQDND